MKPQRRLALKRQSLSDLASDEMRSVVGGTHIYTDCGCLTHGATCDSCPTPTLPLNPCLATIRTLAVAEIELTRDCVS